MWVTPKCECVHSVHSKIIDEKENKLSPQYSYFEHDFGIKFNKQEYYFF